MLRLSLILTAFALLAGCGIKKEVHQRALDELTTCQGELSATKKKLGESEQTLAALRGDKDALTEAQKKAGERINKMSKDMAASEAELLELRKQREAAERRLAAFRKLQQRLRKLVDTGKLTVVFRNGQMVLKLPSEILFASGRGRLSRGGETELALVLDVLKEFSDRRFLVAGHTVSDRVPKSSKFKSNWDLSTARAVSVVRFMVKAGFNAKNLGAAGYGEFDPVASNDDKKGRQQNRRIEIILVPDLSELPNLTTTPGS
jgi:chemotaxis protein MotB